MQETWKNITNKMFVQKSYDDISSENQLFNGFITKFLIL